MQWPPLGVRVATQRREDRVTETHTKRLRARRPPTVDDHDCSGPADGGRPGCSPSGSPGEKRDEMDDGDGGTAGGGARNGSAVMREFSVFEFSLFRFRFSYIYFLRFFCIDKAPSSALG